MQTVAKVLKLIPRIFLYISYLAIAVMAVMTVVDVLRRFLFGLTMNGVSEYSQMLLIVCMTAMAYAIVEGRFIAVSVLVDRFPKKVNLFIEILMGALSFAFFFLVGVQLFDQIALSRLIGEAYFMIGVPKWPMYAALGASFLACIFATVVYVYERIVKFKDYREKTVFDENPELAILAFSGNDHAEEGGEKNGA